MVASEGPAPGHTYTFVLSDGSRVQAEVRTRAGHWVEAVCDGLVFQLNLDQVVCFAAGALPACLAGSDTRAGGSARRIRPKAGGSPGRRWEDDELRLLANAFLDGAIDRDLAREFGRTVAIIKQLRQAFECARGNLDEDRVGEVAQSWIPRWRRVLLPE
ncbi:MAG: hypothetical protein ACOCZK_00240 [Planctomycetota bacterium]